MPTKESDVKLESGGSMVLEGDYVRCTAHDFALDSPGRRGVEDVKRPRRALVHEPLGNGDRLVISYEGDYPAGVWVGGGKLYLQARRVFSADGKAQGYEQLDVVNKTASYWANQKDPDKTIQPVLTKVDYVDLLAEINNLRLQVAYLCSHLHIPPVGED